MPNRLNTLGLLIPWKHGRPREVSGVFCVKGSKVDERIAV
jgi:hypothetical protein